MASMSSSPRERLVGAGTRLLERDGPEALKARKVAAEIGASTMAVYTHFGGMNGLLEAIIAASFERFGAALASRRRPTTQWPTS
jgi:AcrR family transcriptional regulator